MARPTKSGLDYFPLDTDLDNDPDVQVLQAQFGNDGHSTLIKMWSRAYKSTDGEVDFSTEIRVKILAKQCNVSVPRWLKIIQFCVELGLFSEQKFSEKRLTSGGIKRRIQKIFDERERGRTKAKSLDVNKKPELSPGKTPEESRNNSGIYSGKGKGNTEREKEKESIKGSGASAPAPDKPPPKVKPVFVKPTPDECVQHFRDKGYIDPENEGRKFWNWYEQTDWRVGKKRIPMTLWPLAASNWNIKNKQDQVSGRYVKHNEIHPKHNPGLARAQHTVTPDRVAEITRQREERHRQRDQSDAARGRDAPAHVGH
jgi:hypothetical protein